MNPAKVDRARLHSLTDLPNIGKASAADLRLLGIQQPSDLAGRCPFAMYAQLCTMTGVRHDPCVIDVFLSVTHFVDGGESRTWWSFTEERKAALRLRDSG